jgi:hypothetical protein
MHKTSISSNVQLINLVFLQVQLIYFIKYIYKNDKYLNKAIEFIINKKQLYLSKFNKITT